MYRGKVKCDKCGKTYTSIKRKKKTPPVHCKYCGSYMTRFLSVWRVK